MEYRSMCTDCGDPVPITPRAPAEPRCTRCRNYFLVKREVLKRRGQVADLEAELLTLRADKERLDWLGVRTGHAQNLFQAWFKCGVGADIRSEIDAEKEKE